MRRTIRITNFQSIRSADFELGRFTVFVGSSSSGKSAVLRAVKALATNPRGASSYTSYGTKKLIVTVETDRGAVSLAIGSGGAAYTVETDGDSKDYSKLNNAVPDQVAEVLGITKDDVDLVFAGQFDRPYMLDETGSTVARTLGALTNIDLIFNAVRESNRRKQNSSSKLKVREADLIEVEAKLVQLEFIKAKADACTELENRFENLKILQGRLAKLQAAQAEYLRMRHMCDSIRVVPEPPSLDRLIELSGELTRFKEVLKSLVTAKNAVAKAEADLSASDEMILSAERDLADKLTELGICPLCKGVVDG